MLGLEAPDLLGERGKLRLRRRDRATVAEQRADALHSIVDQLTEAEAELLAELLATRTAQAWDPGVASRAEAGLA